MPDDRARNNLDGFAQITDRRPSRHRVAQEYVVGLGAGGDLRGAFDDLVLLRDGADRLHRLLEPGGHVTDQSCARDEEGSPIAGNCEHRKDHGQDAGQPERRGAQRGHPSIR
jgi:hypothetical protein